MRRGRASWRPATRRRRAATRARAAKGGNEASRASSPAPRRTSRSRGGLAGVRLLGCLLGAALLRLLGLAALRLGVRVGDELLASAPAPGPDHEHQREEDAPRRRDE